MSGLRPFSTYSSSSGGTDGSDALPDVVAWRACRLAERVFLHAVRLSVFLGEGGRVVRAARACHISLERTSRLGRPVVS